MRIIVVPIAFPFFPKNLPGKPINLLLDLTSLGISDLPAGNPRYGMMDDGRCSERSASSMRSLVEGADSLLNLKYDTCQKPGGLGSIRWIQGAGE